MSDLDRKREMGSRRQAAILKPLLCAIAIAGFCVIAQLLCRRCHLTDDVQCENLKKSNLRNMSDIFILTRPHDCHTHEIQLHQRTKSISNNRNIHKRSK